MPVRATLRRLGRIARSPWVRSAVGLTVLALVASRVSLSSIAAALSSVRPLPALGAFAAVLAGQVVVARRLRSFAAGVGFDLPTRRALEINLAAAFYALFVPGGNVTAGAVRLYRIAQEGAGASGALAAVLRDRMDATAGLLAVGLLFLLLARPTAPAVGPVLIGGALLGGGLVAILLLFLWARRRTPHRSSDRAGCGVGGWIEGLVASLAKCGRMPARDQVLAFSLSVAAQLLGVLSYGLLARALELDVALTTLGWVRSGVIVLTMIPVSVGGVGLREAGFLLLLAGRGLREEAVLAYSLLVFTVTVLAVAGLGGTWEAFRVWRSETAGQPESAEESAP